MPPTFCKWNPDLIKGRDHFLQFKYINLLKISFLNSMSSTIPDTLERHPPCPNKAFFIMYAADRSIEETVL